MTSRWRHDDVILSRSQCVVTQLTFGICKTNFVDIAQTVIGVWRQKCGSYWWCHDDVMFFSLTKCLARRTAGEILWKPMKMSLRNDGDVVLKWRHGDVTMTSCFLAHCVWPLTIGSYKTNFVDIAQTFMGYDDKSVFHDDVTITMTSLFIHSRCVCRLAVESSRRNFVETGLWQMTMMGSVNDVTLTSWWRHIYMVLRWRHCFLTHVVSPSV